MPGRAWPAVRGRSLVGRGGSYRKWARGGYALHPRDVGFFPPKPGAQPPRRLAPPWEVSAAGRPQSPRPPPLGRPLPAPGRSVPLLPPREADAGAGRGASPARAALDTLRAAEVGC